MSKVTQTKNINAPAERVWEIIADFGNVHKYHPIVKSADLLRNKDRGIGAKRRCHFYDNTSLVEEITDWDEGNGFTVDLTEASMPLKQAQASMRVTPTGAKSSIVTIEMEYVVKYGLMGKLMDVMMMRRMMGKMFTKILSSLEHHVLTGELIGKDGIPVETAPKYVGAHSTV